MKRTLVISVVAAIMLFGAALVFAQGHGFGRGGFGGGPGPMWSTLTDDQKAKLQELRTKLWNEMAPIREKMGSMRQEARKLWTDPKADSQTILAKQKEMRDLRDQMADKMAQMKLEMRSLLTPEQLEKFAQLGPGAGGCGGGGRGGFGGRGGCGGGPGKCW
jgi:Spy/CpxP family protein refolding chaperone